MALMAAWMTIQVHAQNDSTLFARYKRVHGAGLNVGTEYLCHGYLSLGYGKYTIRRNPCWNCSGGGHWSLNMLWNPVDQVYGFRASAWAGSIISQGIHASVYTNGHKVRLDISPEIGLGWRLQVAFGYHFRFGNRELEAINRGYFTLRYMFALTQHKSNLQEPLEGTE